MMDRSPTYPCSLGFDIGGTAIKAGVVDAELRVLATAHRPTPESHTAADVTDTLVSLASELASAIGGAPCATAGIGIPGRAEPTTGRVRGCVNLRGWDDVPLGSLVADALGVPVRVHNDANAAAFGEFARVRRDESDLTGFALLTVGTGIGGGFVLNGQLLIGANQFAGEIGHMIVEIGGLACPCGQHGCLERYAAAPAIAAAGSKAAGEPLTAADVFARAADGDADASAVIDRIAVYLGIATVNLARLLDLQCVFLGGGVAAAGDALLSRVRSYHQQHTWKMPSTPPRIDLARLGNDAGWIGAAALAAETATANAPTDAAERAVEV